MTLRRAVPMLFFALVIPIVFALPTVQSAPGSKPKEKIIEKVVPEAVEGDKRTLAQHRANSTKNLRQLGLALHNYESTTGELPSNILDKDGKPLLSWRVRLLPYLEQEILYKQFQLNEAWDGPTNKELLERMPPVLASPRVIVKPVGHTVYQGFAGPGTLFEMGKKFKFNDITAGSSNTIFAIEASEAVPWTKPVDVPFDPKGALPELGKPYNDVPLAAMLDGSVRALKVSAIDPKVLRASMKIAGE